MLIAVVMLFIGLILLVYGADRLVFGATAIANSLNVPRLAVGIMVTGVGTSLPELAFSVTAGINGKTNMVVGNAIGSNITNILLILGCVAIIRPLSLHSKRLKREAPLLFLIMLLAGFVLYDNQLSRSDGIILLLAFISFMLLVFKMSKRTFLRETDSLSVSQEAETPKEISQTVAFLWILIGVLVLPIAAKITVDNATVVARYLGLSELMISLTIIAIGTSLPELATAITGMYKHEDDMVLGNVIGSNIFNMLVVMGIPALISPGSFFSEAFRRDYWIMLAASLLLILLCVGRSRRLTRPMGIVLLAGFTLYIGVLMYSAYA